LYGVELIIVIIATFGVVQSGWGIPWPDGTKDSMSVVGWLLSWRFIMGIGIGMPVEEYPLCWN
jgi:MFS transporter, PHS family, inorganic phosphate transporter